MWWSHLTLRQLMCIYLKNNHDKFHNNPIRTKYAECAFSIVGPSVWNSLPADLRLETDTAVFKRILKIKSFLFYSVFTQ